MILGRNAVRYFSIHHFEYSSGSRFCELDRLHERYTTFDELNAVDGFIYYSETGSR